MSHVTYDRCKAQGVCPRCQGQPAPGFVYCVKCRQKWQVSYREHCDATLTAPGQQLLLCCGGSHVIDMIPFTAPCCGKVYFQELSR